MPIPSSLPDAMKALVLGSTSDGPSIETIPTPKPAHGGAVVRVLTTTVLHFVRDMYLGKRPALLPLPLTIGTSAVGRIVETGPDATKLTTGDLVFVDMVLRSRDNPNDVCLAGVNDGFAPGPKKLMAEGYRDWTYAEYCLAPLENLTLLDEGRLLGEPTTGGLGYKIEDLNFMATLLVPFSGLPDVGLKAGETVVIAPANGPFGAQEYLLRWLWELESSPWVIMGDVEQDTNQLKQFGQIDTYLDIGPMQAADSTHIKSCLQALTPGGRVSLMGGYLQDIALPHGIVMQKNLKLVGRYMYEAATVPELIKMVENGVLKLGKEGGSEILACYPLEQWREAWDLSVERAGVGKTAVINP